MQLGAHDSASLPSLGFADDTAALANTLANLRVQNEWVHYFMRFNCMRLNHTKCELVGRDAAGLPVTAAALAAAGISIEGNALTPVAHDKAIRYLGVHCSFDGSWHAQRLRTLGMLQLFTRVVSKFRVSLSQATYMFNAFLQPKLELALRYVHGPGTTAWLKGCDRTLVGCIKHAVASPLSLSHSAVALSLHFSLPSWLETSIKVAELFLRINSTECRWGRLGRLLLHRQLPARVIDSTVALPRGDKGTRITRAVMLAVRELDWSLRVWTERHGRALRSAHLLRGQPAGALPDFTVSSGSDALQLQAAACQLTVVHDLWRGWGTAVAAPAQPVHIYTDGSHDSSTPVPSSSWAVTVGDRWLHDNFALVPADEEELAAQPAHAGGAALFGGSIAATRGVYPAELQAIARTLAMFPASCSLHVHSDSQAAIAGIRAYERQTNERQRLRMAARPLLQLIHHLLSVREQAGSSLTLQHVKAHTHNTDMHSVGNRLSDFQANRARLKPLQPKPLCLRELLLQQCEHYVSMWRPSPEAGTPLMIIDDIRRAAMSQLQAAALSRHAKDAAKPESTSYLIGDGSLELGGIVLSHGSASLQRAFVHVATNSIHHLWLPTGRADRSHTVQCLTCVPCTAAHAPPQAFTLQHLVACPHRAAIAFRVKSERAFPALGLGAEAAQDDAVDQLVQLHARLCHMGWTRMMNLLHGGKVEDHGIQVPGLHDRTIREAEQRVRECVACVQGRATRTAFGHRGLDRGAKPGECLHMDTYQVKVDRDGRLVTEYGLVMKDLHTEHVWHAKMQSKDLVAEAVIQRVRRAETQFGCVVKRIYADGGTEFINRTLKKFCEDNGKQLHWTPARSQQLNGAAERTVRTSKESAS